MQRILAVLNRERTAEAVLGVTGMLAARLGGAQITILHPRLSEDPSFMPTEEVMTPDRRLAFDQVSAKRAEWLRAAVDAWSPGLPAGQAPRRLEVIGDPARSVGAEATQADLVVIGHVLADDRDDARAAMHAALFDAAAPVVVAPLRTPGSVGAHPAIGWEAGEAMQAAVQAALPLLLRAETVTFLLGEEHSDAMPEPRALRATLEQAGVRCAAVRFAAPRRDIGDALLDEAKRAGADLIVAGAYTHSRLIERLLGGATEDLLRHAELPLLLHHGQDGR